LLGASEEIYFRIWETNTAPIIYLNGLLLFVAGLLIVRVHIRWTRSWPVMVTLVGWVAILGGLFRVHFGSSTGRSKCSYALILASLVGAIGLL
jgi:hypothetical protein